MKANVPKGMAIRFCFPPMMQTGNMHSKLQLLKYPQYLRVVIPTGNFVPYDVGQHALPLIVVVNFTYRILQWGETGVIENMVFLIDLPRIRDQKSQSSNQLGPFGEELRYFLEAQGLEESLLRSLANYDFTEANRYRFVHTMCA